jgi:hypothetical protein
VPRGERAGSGARANGGGSGAASAGGSGTSGTSAAGGARGRAAHDGSTGSTPNGVADVPAYARPREGNRPIGTAVPRGSVPPANPGGGILLPGGYYPGGYYDPWGYGYGYGGYYGGGGYGGYGGYDPWSGGGYYDPWVGGYSSSQGSYTSNTDDGSVRLKIKPRDAEVYVDGYFVGTVDDFDGVFQRLHVDSGAHRIEVRKTGYEPLAFDVRVAADHTTNYQGELKKIQ